jgi:hypothetical protein
VIAVALDHSATLLIRARLAADFSDELDANRLEVTVDGFGILRSSPEA